MNKNDFCKKLDEMNDGLHHLDKLIKSIQHNMICLRKKTINLNYDYPQSLFDIEAALNDYPKLIDKLIEFGFTVKKIPRETSRYVLNKELVGKKFFGLFNRYKTVSKLETIQMGGETYIISICCEETK